ncbi:hypothetical protein SAMN02745248_02137 [Hathewaya proteolytica DSM 3090]|uniref:BIG2 domain-containing protein n=1 Tax=Hathewaya proteolytica DSM 3090 TaxID=1121331 RepID=A0A1M6QWQ0_9CLOT|nr:Ig-like domain-containing protein [Hathewaya proteolytica]SHK24624.1 hypothetical protein SAMN02745248_02137 [Hathewaya proteolytica DSM 3090]
MNKKNTEVLSGVLATTLGLGSVMGATTVLADTVDQLYKAAFTATQEAQNKKTQEAINVARKAVRELDAALKDNKDLKAQLIGTLSGMLDPLQQDKFKEFYGIIYEEDNKTEKKNLSQEEINKAMEFVESFKGAYVKDSEEYKAYIGAWSSTVDKFQQANTNATVALFEKALKSKTPEDVKAARESLNKLLKTVNKQTKEFAEGLDAQLKVLEDTVAIASVKAVGAKKIEVKFSKPVDTAKAKVTLKKGLITTNVEKVTFADDKMSAIIETTINLTKGTYKVTAEGLTEKALEVEFEVDNEKVSDIKILSENAPIVSNSESKKAMVNFEILNQYGENVTKREFSKVTWTISTGVQASGNNDGTLPISKTAAFIPGELVYVTGVYANATTGVSKVVNSQVKIGLESKANKVEFDKIYNEYGKKFGADFANDKFHLLFDVLDQYGNKIIPSESTLTSLKKTLVFTCDNILFVKTPASDGTDLELVEDSNGNMRFGLKLVRGSMPERGGKVTIQAVSTATGNVSKFEFEATASSEVKTFNMTAPQQIVTVGKTIEIPFEAIDQYGNAITKYADLNGKITFSDNLKFVEITEGANKGKAKLEFKGTKEGMVYITSLVTNGGNFSSMMLDVRAAIQANVIVGLVKDFSKSMVAGDTKELYAKNILAQDQHGSMMSTDDILDWVKKPENRIKVVTTIDKVEKVDYIEDEKASVKLTRADEGKINVSITLQTKGEKDKDFKDVDGSTRNETITVVKKNAFKSFKLSDLGTMYVDTTEGKVASDKYCATPEVIGVLENGTEVVLPVSMYDIKVNENMLTATSSGDIVEKKVETSDFDKDKDTTTTTVTINVKDSNGAFLETLKGTLTLSKVAPAGKSFVILDTAKDEDITLGVGTITADQIRNAIASTVKDQYGIKNAELFAKSRITIKNIDSKTAKADSNNGTATASIIQLTDGDTFVVEMTCGEAKAKATVTASKDVQSKIEEDAAKKALETATAAVEKAEGSKLQADYDAAKKLVDALAVGKDKDALNARLVVVKTAIDTANAEDAAKKALTAKISEVAKVEEGKAEGVVVGNQVVGSKATLDAAKKAAEDVLNNANSKTEQLTQATNTLNDAIEAYKAAVVVTTGTLTAPTLTIAKDNNDPVKGTISGYNKSVGETLVVTSSDADTVSVDAEDGLAVTGKKAGKATITVTVKNADGKVIKVGSVEVTVTKATA